MAQPPLDLPAATAPPRGQLRFLAQLGHVLLSGGDTVAVVEDAVRRAAVAHGARNVSVVALPTALFLSYEDDEGPHVDFRSHEELELRIDQVEDVFSLAAAAAQPAFTPEEGIRRIDEILARPPAFGPAWSVAGHVLVTMGIALVLQPTPGVVASSAGFGLVVGALKLFARNRGVLAMLLPAAAAFLVAAIALLLARHGFAASPLRVLIASIITFVPGGTLAIAIMELAYGDMISGSSRFVAGMLTIVFLILGMVIAASLVGLPAAQLLVEAPQARLGAWAPWTGVMLFAVGYVFHFSARARTLPWVLAALFVAYTAQVVGSAAFGGYMGGFIGALVITPMAYFMQHRMGGPPTMVVFQPALWLLVPGSLGVVGLAELVGEDRLAGLEDFVTALFSIVAISFGTLIGAGLYDAFVEPVFRRTESLVALVWRQPLKPRGRRRP
jgi:uncharacterized membrane protein YjjP (DUF1212 family)